MRLRQLASEMDGLVIETRAFPLRPGHEPDVRFRGTYREEAWRRAGHVAGADGITFTPWPHQRLPGSSLPALEAARCVARQGPELFERVHLALYRAFFTESRDIADAGELTRIVAETGADAVRFRSDYAAGAGREAVLADYRTAVEDHGVRAIPTVVVPATGRVLVGLVDIAAYRKAIAEAAG